MNTLPGLFPVRRMQMNSAHFRQGLLLTRSRYSPPILGLILLVVLLGCEHSPVEKYEPSAIHAEGATKSNHSEAPDGNDYSALPAGAKLLNSQELWHANYLQGKKIGYRHTVVREFELGTQHFTQTDILERQSLLRFGEKVTLEVKASQLANANGTIVQIRYEIPLGTEISRVQGKVDAGKLIYWTEGQPEKAPEQIPFPPETLGFSGLEDSQAKSPLQAGEQRTLKMLQLPPLPLVGTVRLVAKEEEATVLPAGEVRLLRVEERIELPGGGSISCYFWTDSAGQILKYSVPSVQQETFLVTREQALDDREAFSVDLGSDMLVRLPKPLDDPHRKSNASYRIHLKADLPAGTLEKLLPAGLSQQVKPIDDRTALVTVLAIRPDQPMKLSTEQPTPTKADSEPSSLVESEAPEIAALVREATARKPDSPPSPAESTNSSPERDRWLQAVALEKFVHGYLNQKNYSQAFSSAAEVARTREGDCTEHAVLLAALCRARGIPARVAYGLVYVVGEQAFAFHMWDEVWTGDRWVPLDATLALSGIGTGHIKFGHSSLSDISALLELLPVMQSVGKLEVSESTASEQ